MGTCVSAAQPAPAPSRTTTTTTTTASEPPTQPPVSVSDQFALSLRRLQYRELTPEDYEILSRLDERVQRKTVVPQGVVDRFPRVEATAQDSGVVSCTICMCDFGPSVQVVQLPCRHTFHPSCISRWLTQHKNTCPLCSATVNTNGTECIDCRVSASEAPDCADQGDEDCAVLSSESERPCMPFKSMCISVTRSQGVGGRCAARRNGFLQFQL